MEIATAVAGPAVETLMNPVTKNLHYLISCTEYVKDMKDKIDDLNHKRNDVQDIMASFEHNNLHIPSCVPSWLAKVQVINAEVEEFPSDVGRCNLNDKRKYGKQAFKIIERTQRLIEEEDRIKWSDHKFVQTVSMKASRSKPSSDHDDSQSRKQASTEAPKALESEDKSHIVASCDVDRAGKTTMMENEKKGAIEKKRFNFTIKSKNNVRVMNDKIVQLNHTREDVEQRMMWNKNSNLEIPFHVHSWLKDVGDINALVESFPNDVLSCGMMIRPKLRKKALEIIQNIDRLIDEESWINWTNDRISLGKVVSMSASTSTTSGPGNEFESRKQTFMEALKALESDHESHMVGLCGMAAVGKTVMMEQLKKVVTERKIFDFIIKVVVGVSMHIIAIQQVVAAYLGLNLAGGNKETRAIELRKCFEAYSAEGKKFLIILDDVWEFFDLTDIGLSHFPNQGVDFKILLTSRDQSVCIEMGVEVNSILNVEVLTTQEAQSFFLQFARDSKDDDFDLDLCNIGNDIAIRCEGLPLAIKVYAGTLRGERKCVWEDALSRLEHHQLHELFDDIFETSYIYLKEEEARLTLLLCSLFHEDFDIPKEDLVRYAWGLNLFGNVYTISEARNRMSRHVERLIDANLLIKGQHVGYVKIHSLVCAFVLHMCSKGEHESVVGDMSLWPTKDTSESCKRISLMCGGMSEFPRDRKYPSLLLLRLIHGDRSLQFPDDFYQEMGNLQVLAYEEMNCHMSLRSLQCSTNLRTMCFHGCSGMFDLSHIGDLLNLEVLSFAHCLIEELPSTIGNLKKLRLLDLTCCDNLRICDGVLKNLVKLEELYMRHSGVTLELTGGKEKANKLRNVNGDELASCSKNLAALEVEFRDDNAIPKGMSFEKLRRFKISVGCSLKEENDRKGRCSFENKLTLVTNKDQLLEFRINELFGETEVLHLQVDDVRNGLVESFYPHHSSFYSLRVLEIVKCVDLRYLFTARVANVLTKLERLTVYSCPVLETLIHSENSGVEDLEFRALKFLSLGELPTLKSFCNDINAIKLPQLEELILDSLPNFTSIYPNNKPTSSMRNDTSSMQPFLNKEIVIPRLKKMIIRMMDNLEEIWPSDCGEAGFSVLKEIEVEGCPSLVNLFPINPTSSFLHHLEEVKVTNCDSIDVLFNIDLGRVGEIEEGNSKLKSIKLSGLRNLREIWMVKGENASNGCIMGFEALESIEIFRCESLNGVFPPTNIRFDKRELMKVSVDGDDGWLRKNDIKAKRFEEREASSHEPTTTEHFESRSSYANLSMEVEVLKEKLAKYEKDREEVEWKHRAELDAQRKETIDQLARQIAISEQFSAFMKQFSTFTDQCSAFMMQFQSTNPPPPPPPPPSP